jgi:hypothetical protein
MLALDFEVQCIHARHRVSLFSLLKVNLEGFESSFVRIAEVNDLSNIDRHNIQNLLPRRKPFGFLTLLEESNIDRFVGNEYGFHLEVFHDSENLNLICGGSSTVKFLPLKKIPTEIKLNRIRSHFMHLVGSTSTVGIPIFHFTQGKFQIEAGIIYVCINIYNIDFPQLLHVREEQFLALQQHPVEDVKVTKISIPEIITAEELNRHLQNDIVEDSLTTEDIEKDIQEDYYDEFDQLRMEDNKDEEIDEFVHNFLKKSTLQSSVNQNLSHQRDNNSTQSLSIIEEVQKNHSELRKPFKKKKKLKSRVIGAAADRARWLYK